VRPNPDPNPNPNPDPNPNPNPSPNPNPNPIQVGHLSGGLAAHGQVAVIMPGYERFFQQWQHAAP